MEENTQANPQQSPSFTIEKIYVKDLSLEVPNAPQIYLEQKAPQIEVQINTAGKKVGEDAHDVVLTITLTSKLEDKTFFLVEVAQAGIFRLQNIPEDQVSPILGVACPNILFPYAREVISDVVIRAGFPPLVLQPINFEAMYLARLEEQKRAAAAPAATVQ
ncbi:MAG: Protein-export protein SecB [Betaproteobacteria bacterium ADurb.Bin341]|nr:MAG: Protein-export protein SecB [Betaproteobacteria bacterium ADurb.Bin341]